MRPPIIVRPPAYYPPYRPAVPAYAPPAPVYRPAAPAYSAPVAPAPAYSAPAASAPAAPPACPCPDNGTYLWVVFQPTATIGDVSAFLKSLNLTMADGPNEAGAYRLLVYKGPVPPDQLNQLVESMRQQTSIVSQVNN